MKASSSNEGLYRRHFLRHRRREPAERLQPLRAASQYGAALILNRAAAEGYEIILNSTLQSPMTLGILDKLKGLGYRIEADSVAAPLAVSRARNNKRARIIPEEDLLAKRPNFYRQLPQIVGHTDRFSLSWNPVDGQAPRKASNSRKAA